MAGVAPQGPTDMHFKFSLHFSFVNPLIFHGSSCEHFLSLVPSIPNRFYSKKQPGNTIKSTLGMQQLNHQEFNNVLQELHFSSFNLLKIAEFKQVGAWVN